MYVSECVCVCVCVWVGVCVWMCGLGCVCVRERERETRREVTKKQRERERRRVFVKSDRCVMQIQTSRLKTEENVIRIGEYWGVIVRCCLVWTSKLRTRSYIVASCVCVDSTIKYIPTAHSLELLCMLLTR